MTPDSNELLARVEAGAKPDAMRDALAPFAKAAEAFDSWPRDMKHPDEANICTFIRHEGTIADGATINYGHCRNARTALRSAPVSGPAVGVTRAGLAEACIRRLARCNINNAGQRDMAADDILSTLQKIEALPVPDATVSEPVSDSATVPLADHDEISRKVINQPWDIQKAIVTIAAHCTALTDECPTGTVADLAGCISQGCLELANALASPQHVDREATVSARDGAIEEEELARCLYEAEYDGETYPWHRQSSAEQATYRQQARKVLRTFDVRSLASGAKPCTPASTPVRSS